VVKIIDNARDRRHGTARLLALPVGIGLLAWAFLFGGPVWAVFVYTGLVLATTLPYLPDDLRRKHARAEREAAASRWPGTGV
jgi:hypothetical protein